MLKQKKQKVKKKIYDKLLAICLKEYNSIEDKEKEEMDKKYDPSSLFIKGYKYDKLYKRDEEKSKSQLEETIVERVKLRRQKAEGEDCLTCHQ